LNCSGDTTGTTATGHTFNMKFHIYLHYYSRFI
jgi:hypothetical protein